MNPTTPTISRRTALLGSVLPLLSQIPGAFAAGAPSGHDTADVWAAVRNGAIVLLRHANAPGFGDPPSFRIGDCTTQRNLDDNGRAQAQRIGAAFRQQRARPGKVLASQWCRTRDTAELAFPGQVSLKPAFNSFFQDRDNAQQQTATARAVLAAWNGPGALVVVTHQVNITALTGLVPASGEGIVLRAVGDTLEMVGRLAP